MMEAGLSGNQHIDRLKSRPNRMLITILLGNNLVNIGASVMSAAWTTAVFSSAALGAATAVLTLLVLIFGEIFPKSVAQQHAERFARVMARPLLYLERSLYPLIIALEWLLNRTMRVGRTRPGVLINAEAEVRATVEELSRDGRLDEAVHHLVSGTFRATRRSVGQIMTPRARVVSLRGDASLEAARRLFMETALSRLPVFRDELDHVYGILSLHTLLKAEYDRKSTVHEAGLAPPVFFTPQLEADELITLMQSRKQQLALVRSARGRVLGVVTLENALEEIVGEIFDEQDCEREFVEVDGHNVWRVTGDCPIQELRRYFRAFEPAEAPFNSLASLFVDGYREGLPRKGARMETDEYAMEVTAFRINQLTELRVTRKQ